MEKVACTCACDTCHNSGWGKLKIVVFDMLRREQECGAAGREGCGRHIREGLVWPGRRGIELWRGAMAAG